MARTAFSAVKVMTPTLVVERGFTLLELMVVLAIVLIATGLIVPNLGVLDSKAFDGDVRAAVSLLNYTRRLAIVDGSPQSAHFVTLDPNDKQFAEKEMKARAARKSSWWVSNHVGLGFRQEQNQPEAKREDIIVTFFPQGGSTGGVLEFSLNDFSAKLRIDPITGRITTAYRGEELKDEKEETANAKK